MKKLLFKLFLRGVYKAGRTHGRIEHFWKNR